MGGIEMKNNVLYYYGNPAGFYKDQKATADVMFKSQEFEIWLAENGFDAKWEEGVFERLAKGKQLEPLDQGTPLKNVRIWQLKPESDFRLRFRPYEEALCEVGEISRENYNTVYDGPLETNDLESIYAKFNMDHPEDFKGHSLSISDVVELYDGNGSAFFYVDYIGFTAIEFNGDEPRQTLGMSL